MELVEWALIWGWLPVWSRDLEEDWALVWGWLPVWSLELEEDLGEGQASAFGHCLARHRFETFTRLKSWNQRPLRELAHQVAQLGSLEQMACLRYG